VPVLEAPAKRDTCGALVKPLSTCQSQSCVKERRNEKKADLEAKAASDKKDIHDFYECVKTKLATGKCCCPGECKWKNHQLCPNPPCGILLSQGTNCRRKIGVKYRKDNGIVANKPKKKTSTRTASNRLQKKHTTSALSSANTSFTTKKKAKVADSSDSDSDGESSNSDDSVPSDSSEDQFEIETIVSGPSRKKGQRYGKYEIKWVGYDSEDNTWEPRSHIPHPTMRAYDAQQNASRMEATLAAANTGNTSDLEDDIPLATLVSKK
jgi:hypothetical protein